MQTVNTPLYDLVSALRSLSYDDMLRFAEHVGNETGSLGQNFTGMYGDEISASDIAEALRSFADQVDTGEKK